MQIVFMMDGDRYKLSWFQRRTLKELFEKGIPQKDVRPLKSMTEGTTSSARTISLTDAGSSCRT